MKIITLLFTFILLICFHSTFGQDIIIKKNGEQIKCKIVKDGALTIFYTLAEDTLKNLKVKRSLVERSIYEFTPEDLLPKANMPIDIEDMASMKLDSMDQFIAYRNMEIDYNQLIGNNLIKAGIGLIATVAFNSIFNLQQRTLTNELSNPENTSGDFDDINEKINESINLQIAVNVITLGFTAGNLTMAGIRMKKKHK